jgi:DNA-binding transcriptional MocR family regulator
MLTYVPVTFAVYRPLKPYLRWTLMCLVGFADHSGQCFPSLRTLAEVADIPRSTMGRHLSQLVKCGAITRTRRPGGVYTYQIDPQFLPATRVSHARAAAVPPAARSPVPPIRAEEQSFKNRSDSALPNDQVQWAARVRGWEKRRFWLLQWGPRPDETGCFAPAEVLRATIAV